MKYKMLIALGTYAFMYAFGWLLSVVPNINGEVGTPSFWVGLPLGFICGQFAAMLINAQDEE